MSRWLFLCLCLPLIVHADEVADKQAQLQAISTQIETLDAQLTKDAQEQSALQQTLKELDLKIADLAKKLQATKTQISDNKKALRTLEQQYTQDLQKLQVEQNLLREQIRSTFLQGHNQTLKLWLSQTDPQVLARLLTYFDYFNAARARLLQDLQADLTALMETKAEKQAKQDTLEALQIKQQQAHALLAEQTQAQSALVAQLLTHIEKKSLTLETLRADKEALESVITQLAAAHQTFIGDSSKPIRDYQGKLPWPVQGRVLHRFGEVYAAQSTWQGVFIAAPLGTPVRAIYAGQVVYADWLRGLGLIVIVNHGNEYMSLYAHNQSLYKNVGDSVAANEAIAEVGKSGSVADSGLYFEMRFKGEVQNPASWLMPT